MKYFSLLLIFFSSVGSGFCNTGDSLVYTLSTCTDYTPPRNISLYIDTFNQSNLRVARVGLVWKNNSWRKLTYKQYVFDAAQNLIENNYSDSDSTSADQFRLTTTIQNTYNGFNQLINRYDQNFNTNITLNTLHIQNANSLDSLIEITKWDGSNWVDSSRSFYYYNLSGKIIQIVTQNFINGAFLNSGRTDNTWSGQLKLNTIDYQWNQGNLTWDYSSLDSNVYDINNRITDHFNFIYNSGTSSWDSLVWDQNLNNYYSWGMSISFYYYYYANGWYQLPFYSTGYYDTLDKPLRYFGSGTISSNSWLYYYDAAGNPDSSVYAYVSEDIGDETMLIRYFYPGSNPVFFAGDDQSLCANDSVKMNPFFLSGTYPPYTFSGGPGIVVRSNNVDSCYINPVSSRYYVLNVTDSIGNTFSDSVYVEVFPVPDPTLYFNGSNVKCFGDSLRLYTNTTGVSFAIWQNSSSIISVSPDLYVSSTDDYWFTNVGLNGCRINSDTQNVFFRQPQISISTGLISAQGICDGSLSITSVDSIPQTYFWSTGDTTSSINSLCVGTYYLIVTDSMSCLLQDTISLTEPPSFNISYSDSICTGCSNGFIALQTSGGCGVPIITWIPSIGTYANDTISGLPGGNYTVCLEDCIQQIYCQNIFIYESPLEIVTQKANEITIHFNPATNLVSFTGPSTMENIQLKIFDSSMKFISNESFKSFPFEVDNRKSVSGIYFIELVLGNQIIKKDKLVIIRN